LSSDDEKHLAAERAFWLRRWTIDDQQCSDHRSSIVDQIADWIAPTPKITNILDGTERSR